MQKFAAFLEKYIKDSGLSYRKAADMCGIDRTLLGRYAKGQRVPSGETVLEKIATGLNMSEEDKATMFLMYKNDKNRDEDKSDNLFIQKICSDSYEYRNCNIKLDMSIESVESNIVKYLPDWKTILKYIMYIVDGADEIYMRVDPEYKNIFRSFDFGKERFSEMDVTCIVRLHGSDYSDKFENIRYFYAFYPILSDVKSCKIYNYYRDILYDDATEINFVISNKGVVVFDKSLINGLFSNKTGYVVYYRQVFDRMCEKCNLYAKSDSNDSDGENGFGFVYDEENAVVKLSHSNKNNVYIAEAQLIRQFAEYFDKR